MEISLVAARTVYGPPHPQSCPRTYGGGVAPPLHVSISGLSGYRVKQGSRLMFAPTSSVARKTA